MKLLDRLFSRKKITEVIPFASGIEFKYTCKHNFRGTIAEITGDELTREEVVARRQQNINEGCRVCTRGNRVDCTQLYLVTGIAFVDAIGGYDVLKELQKLNTPCVRSRVEKITKD